jgi:hypothetical protein
MDPLVKRGEHRLIRVDGTDEVRPGRIGIREINRLISADGLDSVTLRRHGGYPTEIMMVDDTGMVDGKPVNPKATELYHSICKPGMVWAIHGDVVIVHDSDFK